MTMVMAAVSAGCGALGEVGEMREKNEEEAGEEEKELWGEGRWRCGGV